MTSFPINANCNALLTALAGTIKLFKDLLSSISICSYIKWLMLFKLVRRILSACWQKVVALSLLILTRRIQ
jgi:hypothetical protein